MNYSLRFTLLISVYLFWGNSRMSCAQSAEVDSLKRQLVHSVADTNQVRLLNQLARLYLDIKPDTTYRLAHQAYQLAQQLDDKPGQARGLSVMGSSLASLGDYPKAIRCFQQSLQISRSIHDLTATYRTLNNMAAPYQDQQDHRQALRLLQESQRIFEQVHRNDAQRDAHSYATLYGNLGEAFLKIDQLDSADYYLRQALPLSEQKGGRIVLEHNLYQLGDLQLKRHDTTAALAYYRRGLVAARESNTTVILADIYLRIATVYQAKGPIDSCIVNARRALLAGQQSGYLNVILSTSELLTKLYEGRDNTQALGYYKVAVAARDSLFSQEKLKQLLTLGFEEQQHRQEQAATEALYQNRIRLYGLSALMAVVVLVAGLLWRTNQRQLRSNQLLTRQKTELDQQRSKAEQALRELQTTQTQLIQKEKMASLGELTAGIAHEIQNPLNFVNNFAEVGTELIEEFQEEMIPHLSPVQKEQAVEFLNDLSQSLRKITHHGRRADAIVKGMLAHSRSATGTKELTNLNALAREYFHLAYQGMRSKDKEHFNVTVQTDLDESMGPVSVIPQDIGRVLLNLFNNAFYAVQEKKNRMAMEDYQPTVWLRTFQETDQVIIQVQDNGMGIPESVQDKIFQPFFTTKPTGEGTGLGLSLSYDLVTKGHAGSLTVKSEPGQYTRMQVALPLNPIPQPV
ncbi:tetratricopeptide repeat-containing sensor histidine kinase [Larkinella terrae]|uniref:histidine kinase n=1 Tax=Larkinella terrae TaxID=2025311 RepID=A0A7K0EQA8_9BACT|nr:ATP-binding protein [Larkinella terrae]MRS64010.1 tetratricopeptide repeat protein [Larkinella terrae]